jgi:two-component system, response regulator PdtaR
MAQVTLGHVKSMEHFAAERPVVLIVEDEFLVRTCAAEVIRDAGFEVIEASDADEAIVLLESRIDIRVVFTDIQMPGTMDGLKLAHAIRNRWPPVHILATSGYQVVQQHKMPAGCLFFPMPYSPDHIANTLLAITAS